MAISRIKAFTLLEIMIVVAIMGILMAIIMPALKEHEQSQTADQKAQEYSLPDQPQDISPANQPEVTERCIEGVTYILVTKDGKNFMAPKEDRWGDNERCYE